MLLLSDKLNKSILDPIHGLIKMTETEMRIISHPLFNRLRRIKQNTFLYYVFPSANHTRFEHSIGVMHLASEMFLNAFNNSSTLKNKQKKYNISGNDNILGIEALQQQDFETIYYDLRIAALLHDIGHGPMSHLFDKYAPSNDDFIKMVRYDNDLIIEDNGNKTELNKELADSMRALIPTDKLNKHVEHEYVSFYFTAKLLKDLNFKPEQIKRILSIMNEELGLAQFTLNLNGEEFDIIPFLNQIVAGAPLDCDRMDYLLRDSYFTGVKYGIYDLNRLLKSLLPYIDKNKKIIRLGIKKSGLPAIENFLQARYELYIQIYFHKTNRSCNSMLIQATRNLKPGDFIKCDNPTEFINTYLNLSDENFLNMLETLVTSSEDKQTINDLKNRKLWKRILEIYPSKGRQRKSDIEEQLHTIKKAIIDKYPSLEPFIKEDIIQDNPLKGLNKEKAVLLKKDKDENYILESQQNWLSESIIFQALSSNFLVGRLYIRADTSTQDGKETYRKIKEMVNDMLD
jgi:uncharacterized protein